MDPTPGNLHLFIQVKLTYLMESGAVFIHLARLIYLFSLILPISCSGRFNIHAILFHERCIETSLLEDPAKMIIFEERIIPWLKENGNLSDEQISAINFEKLNRSVGSQLPSFFSDSKKLFALVELLIRNDLNEIGLEVLRFIRSSVFICSTLNTLVASISHDNLIVFNHVLKLWYPTNADIVSAIHNLVDLRLGEDAILEIIDIVWDKLVTESSEKFINYYFSKILISSMLKHYVSVFEDILDRCPNLIQNFHHRMNNTVTIVHYFCHGTDWRNLNRLRIYRRRVSPASYERTSRPTLTCSINRFYLDHRARSYPEANKDLLAIMKRFGANINARDKNGMTPLHLAIHMKNGPIVQELLRAGADYQSTFEGKSMATFFTNNYSKEVEAVLKKFYLLR